jgi:DNA ligase-1
VLLCRQVKKDYIAGMTDSLDLVPIGAFYGKGKRTGVFGAYLLACYNDETEDFETICKIGTGFSDEQLKEFHTTLSPFGIDQPKSYYQWEQVPKDTPDVWLEPKVR